MHLRHQEGQLEIFRILLYIFEPHQEQSKIN